MAPANKHTKDKAIRKPTAKKEILKDLPVNEDRDVKGGAIDGYLWFPPPPQPPPSETRH
jgi:hypothetical protein